MKTRSGPLLLAMAICLAPPLAQAAGWVGVLHGGPAEDFNDEDVRLFMEAAKKTLEAPGEPRPVEWRNEQSGAGGSFTVVGQPQVKGFSECRRLRGTMHSARRTGGKQTWTACKDAGGRWKVVAVD